MDFLNFTWMHRRQEIGNWVKWISYLSIAFSSHLLMSKTLEFNACQFQSFQSLLPLCEKFAKALKYTYFLFIWQSDRVNPVAELRPTQARVDVVCWGQPSNRNQFYYLARNLFRRYLALCFQWKNEIMRTHAKANHIELKLTLAEGVNNNSFPFMMHCGQNSILLIIQLVER